MKQKLSRTDSFFIGSMLFGMFFGAGNLIFPIKMGQLAGQAIGWANLGFLVTAIGIPFLGIMAIGFSGGTGLFGLASRINHHYAYFFTVVLYLVIGPIFAMPRLASTSFEIAFAPLLSPDLKVPALTLYSVLFFGLAYFLSKSPGKLMDIIGKYITPAFLVVLGGVLALAFIKPMGSVHDAAVDVTYQTAPFLKGFIGGYNTLDALAALAFGIVVVTAMQNRGITAPKWIAVEMTKSGLIAVGLMSLIYTLLAFAGARSVGQLAISENGGIALRQMTAYYLGHFGSVILALIVFLGCLKTCIGLMTSCSETFNGLFPRRTYGYYLVWFTVVPAIIANVGLTQIIELAIPVLMFIYPLAITLIILGVASAWLPISKEIYVSVTALTLIAATFDGLKAAPAALANSGLVTGLVKFAGRVLPLFDLGMGWLLPACLGVILGLVWQTIAKRS